MQCLSKKTTPHSHKLNILQLTTNQLYKQILWILTWYANYYFITDNKRISNITIIIDKSLVAVGSLLLQGHSRRPNKNENYRRACTCLQSTTSNSLTVNMMQQTETRKLALHARMSHSTVCNTTISTKKTLRTLMKLENGRSTPGCLTVQSAIRPSVLKRLFAYWWNKYASCM